MHEIKDFITDIPPYYITVEDARERGVNPHGFLYLYHPMILAYRRRETFSPRIPELLVQGDFS